MKKLIIVAVMLSGLFAFSGCGAQSGNVTDLTSDSTPDTTSSITPDLAPDHTDAVPDITPSSKRDDIPFEAGQLYAVAYLGYQTADGLGYYAERYLDSDQLPVHYVSDGDYYLVIPRYDGMSLSMYVNDLETSLGFRDTSRLVGNSFFRGTADALGCSNMGEKPLLYSGLAPCTTGLEAQ